MVEKRKEFDVEEGISCPKCGGDCDCDEAPQCGKCLNCGLEFAVKYVAVWEE